MKRVVRTFLKNEKGDFLMVKHVGRDYWTLPGGHLEDNESIYQAIKREINEELGLKIKILGNKLGLNIENIKELPSPICCYKINFINGKGKEVKKTEYIFLSEIKSGDIITQEKEISEYKFFTKEELLNEEKTFKQVKEILKCIK